ncbi:MAG: NAD(P)/FAD-dependent oxidoreductase [Leptospirales bacterium]|nr:NAD(P)/FAD-dependent oxidoreductase [Leptospirales bacterium]
MHRFFHAVVVGGGPAGLSAAIVLRREGLEVALIEKHSDPLDKACGEGIMPSGLALLAELGVTERIGKLGYPIKGISYTAGNTQAVADFLEGPGLGLRRPVLIKALCEVASDLGVTFYREDWLPAFPFTGEVRLRTADIRTNLLIAADGLHSRIRRLAGLQLAGRTHHRWGIRQHFRTDHVSDYVQVILGENCEAYITPVARNEAGQAILWNSKKISPAGGDDSYDSLRDYLPESLLRGDTTSSIRAVGPLEQRTSDVITDGCVLIGDAAGYVDAITGEGISLAVEQAFALRCLVPVLHQAKEPVPRAALARYSADYRRITFNYKISTRALLFLSERFWLARWIVLLLSRRTRLFQALLSFNMGRLRLRDLLSAFFQ